jgi:integrase
VDARELAGHSLRRGGATAAARAGKAERTIMAQTGHKSVTMVRKYITEAERWKDNAVTRSEL